MNELTLLLSLFAVDLLAQMSPGPAFLMVSEASVRGGMRAGFAAVLGLIAANLIWCGAVIGGLTLLFQAAPWLYAALKIGGGLYLLYLGITLLCARRTSGEQPTAAATASMRRSFLKGVFIGLTNPKAAVYFGSIFTLFLKPGTPIGIALAAIAIVLFDTALWYGVVGALFSRPRVQRAYTRARLWIERVTGAVLAAFGLRLIFSKD